MFLKVLLFPLTAEKLDKRSKTMGLRNKSCLVALLFCVLVVKLQVVCGMNASQSSTDRTYTPNNWSGEHTDSDVSTTTSDNEADLDMKTINTDPTATQITERNSEPHVMNAWNEDPESYMTLDECKNTILSHFPEVTAIQW